MILNKQMQQTPHTGFMIILHLFFLSKRHRCEITECAKQVPILKCDITDSE